MPQHTSSSVGHTPPQRMWVFLSHPVMCVVRVRVRVRVGVGVGLRLGLGLGLRPLPCLLASLDSVGARGSASGRGTQSEPIAASIHIRILSRMYLCSCLDISMWILTCLNRHSCLYVCIRTHIPMPYLHLYPHAYSSLWPFILHYLQPHPYLWPQPCA